MRVKLLVLLSFLTLAISGCGGLAGINPFLGTFNGSWTQTTPSDTGTASFAVLPNGTLAGSMHDNQNNSDATVSGTISDTGVVTATVTFTGLAAQTLTGTMSFNQQGHLVGNMNLAQGGNSTGINFDLIQQ